MLYKVYVITQSYRKSGLVVKFLYSEGYRMYLVKLSKGPSKDLLVPVVWCFQSKWTEHFFLQSVLCHVGFITAQKPNQRANMK